METKPAWACTETWMALASSVIGVLVMMGKLTSDDATQINGTLQAAIGGTIQLVSIAMYVWSRVKVKQARVAMFEAQAYVKDPASFSVASTAVTPKQLGL